MKKSFIGIITLFVILISLNPTASAVNSEYEINMSRASQYISSYNAGISFNGNNIIVNYAVYGTGYMNTIGAQSIILQRNQSGNWIDVYTWTDIYEYNSVFALGGITYPISAGNQYRAVITFYAANTTGYATRTLTTGSYTAQ